MQPKTALLWWHLNILTKRRYDVLVEAYGSIDHAEPALREDILAELGCRYETIKTVLRLTKEFDADRLLQDMAKHHVNLLSIEDDAYPSALREIGDAPIFLSYSGDLSILQQPLLGVVGTRKMSAYGRRVVEHFVPSFVRSGVVTVSGLALGVDAAVANDTIAAGGKTIAVLGSGIGKIYPAYNARLARVIVERGGLILSEFPLFLMPGKFTFPARNRIIAGLSLGTLVIEAPLKSGSIITAELALEYGRDVYAVPGPIFDQNVAGTHDLITHGKARLVIAPEEVLQEIGVIAAEQKMPVAFAAQSPEEQSVYDALTSMPQIMDGLVLKTGLTVAQIGTALTMMELSGSAKNIGAGQWVRR